MNDIGQESVPTIRSRCSWSRLIGAACIVCVLASFGVLTLWYTRPTWYTFVSKQIQGSPGYRLVVRVPVDWECLEEGHTPGCTVIRIHRKTLVGLAQWWQQYVLRHPSTQDSEEQYTVSLLYYQVTASNNDADHFRFLVAGLIESSKSTCRTYEHPLGSALERIYAEGSAEQSYVTRIVVHQHPKGQRLEVIASLTGATSTLSRTLPDWKQIVRSIRIVQK